VVADFGFSLLADGFVFPRCPGSRGLHWDRRFSFFRWSFVCPSRQVLLPSSQRRLLYFCTTIGWNHFLSHFCCLFEVNRFHENACHVFKVFLWSLVAVPRLSLIKTHFLTQLDEVLPYLKKLG